MKRKKIIICGVHFTPALAIIEQLKEKDNIDVFYIGRKYPLEADDAFSLEYITLKKLKVPFFSLYGGRLQRTISWNFVTSLLKFPLSIIQSAYLLMKIRPDLILSFGGYIALPVCLVGFLFRIPVITHEQTRKLGLANRVIARYARIVCLSWPDTKNIPIDAKTAITGNPIRKSILQISKDKSSLKNSDKSLIYITGGSLGSHSINIIVGDALEELTSKYRIIHQCGNSNNHQDYHYLLHKKTGLSQAVKNNYQITESITPSEVGKVYQQTALIVGRSGVNTITEIMMFGIPAVLIPLPWAGGNEQEDNALMMKQLSLAEVIYQKDLTSQGLIETINKMMGKISIYRKNSYKAKHNIILNASDRIVSLIEESIS